MVGCRVGRDGVGEKQKPTGTNDNLLAVCAPSDFSPPGTILLENGSLNKNEKRISHPESIGGIGKKTSANATPNAIVTSESSRLRTMDSVKNEGKKKNDPTMSCT